MTKPSLFVPTAPPHRLSYPFTLLSTLDAQAPARDEMQLAFDQFDDVDGNFLQQFQTDAYEARLFELFLAKLFRHEGFVRNSLEHRPDFVLTSADGIDLCVEAVTANPSEGAARAVEPPRGEDFETLFKRLIQEAVAKNTALAQAAAQNEFRTRLARPLTKKLDKRYWELPHVSGKPLVLAIQDFHAEGSLLLMSESFARFLYGDFFRRPNTEHVSAVMFVNTAAASKFNRMRYQVSASAYPRIAGMMRAGWHVEDDSLDWFFYKVGDPAWLETWGQGITVFHNPEPAVALPPTVFQKTMRQCLWPGGVCKYERPAFHPEASITSTLSTY